MPEWLWIAGGAAALGLGVWIGLGAPGWPWPPRPSGGLARRSLNPIAWGRGRHDRLSRRSEGRRPRRR